MALSSEPQLRAGLDLGRLRVGEASEEVVGDLAGFVHALHAGCQLHDLFVGSSDSRRVGLNLGASADDQEGGNGDLDVAVRVLEGPIGGGDRVCEVAVDGGTRRALLILGG